MPLFRVSGIPVGVDRGALIMLGIVVLVLSSDYREILGPEQQLEAFGYAVVAASRFLQFDHSP